MIKNISPQKRKPKRYYPIMNNKLPFPNDLVQTLYYNLDDNTFSDEFGWTIYDIYRIISPTQVMMFKEKGGAASFVRDVTNSFFVELVSI